ncbi:MAG: type I-E CRISPR-associated endonuclease Cas1e [bacterium]|nr:type I-E CRISPR-associated endonuclease Cas1e [bacterium]
MRVQDLHVLPKFSDGWSYLYVEHCRIDQEARAIAIHDETGKVPVPCANLALLMLGPGVSITHAAISVLADHGCLVAWCGEEGVRFYATGMGETRSAANFLHQARMWSNEALRMKVVRRLYQLRFTEKLDPGLTLQQIRGMEGVRVRESYAKASRETGVPWSGRSYRRDKWSNADPVNRALSAANSCLYGICHAAIVSVGFTPALGFIHTGKMLSFVYDIADLYKADVSIPLAFNAVAEDREGLERRVRLMCRDKFASARLLERVIPDIQTALMLPKKGAVSDMIAFDQDAAAPGSLWDPVEGQVEGGRIHPLEDETEADDGGSDP